METAGWGRIRGEVRCEWVFAPSHIPSKAQQIRDGVLFSFCVLRGKAVGAFNQKAGNLPGDELDRRMAG
jgi:hypothetical protein